MELLFVNQAEIETPLTDEQLFELYITCYDKIMSQDLAQEVALAKLIELYWQLCELTPETATHYDDDGSVMPSMLEIFDKQILEFYAETTDIDAMVYTKLWHDARNRYQKTVQTDTYDEAGPKIR